MTSEEMVRAEARDQETIKSQTFNRIVERFGLDSKRTLDIGCGNGAFMERFGNGSVGITTNPKEVSYGALKGRDIRIGNAERLKDTIGTSERFDAIWCNNIFEHLLSPHAFLVNLKAFAHEDTLLILGTPMIPNPYLLLHLPRFHGSLAEEHINFFTARTYQETIARCGWSLIELRSFKFQSKTIDGLFKNVMPHLYFVGKNNFEYQYPARKLVEWEHDTHYEELLKTMGNKK